MDRLMLMAMGGYGDMGMMDGSTAGTGLIDSIKTKLSFLPEWAAILVIAVLVILAAMLVGWIGGKIIGSILYPDPDKQSILSKKQKFMVLGGAIAAIALTIFALTYTPAPPTFLRELLGRPEGETPIMVLCVGKPDPSYELPKLTRKELGEFTSFFE